MGLGNLKRKANVDFGAFLDEEVYPALFARLDSAFPEFGWARRGKAWTATSWPAGFPYSVGHETPGRLEVYPDRPWWIKIHGHGGVRFLDYVNGGKKPVGPEFPEAVRKLAELAGVTFPEREYSEEEVEKIRRREARRDALSVVIAHAHEILFSEQGGAARAYLQGRGLTEEDMKTLHLGLYDSVKATRDALRGAGVAEEDLKETLDGEEKPPPFLWSKWEGYILFPWYGDRGHPLTLYGRWVGNPPEGKPKTYALAGEGTKASPLYFDRARAAGHKDLVLVEGVMDAALLQVKGDSRVVASVAAELSGLQVETLVKHRIRKVFVCGDPDGGGDKGTLANISALTKAGIPSFVVPRLPDGMDPDEYVNAHGLKAWKDRVDASESGAVFKARLLLGDVTPESPDHLRREKAEELAAFTEGLRGKLAALDMEDVLKLGADRTGYTPGAVADVAQQLGERRRREEQERLIDSAIQSAAADRAKGKGALDVARSLEKDLASVKVKAEEPPPPFDVDRLEKESRETPSGKLSGWDTLDRLEVSFNPGELAVFGARTGHCKTSVLVGLLVNWLKAAETERREEVLVFYSQEEPEVRVYHRLLSVLSATEGNGWTVAEVRDFLRGGFVSRGPDYNWIGTRDTLEKARETLRKWEDLFIVVFRPSWTVEELEAHARDLATHRNVGGVLVDYLQRIPPPAGRYERRDIEVSTVARRLKALAVDLNAPVITGAQVNREAIPTDYRKKLKGKTYEDAKKEIREARPDLAHLREGGAEQEADLVLGLLNYAADYKTDEDGEQARRPPEPSLLEVGTLKNRYGIPGQWARLAYRGKFNLIRDPSYKGEV